MGFSTFILECIQYSFNEEFYLGLHPHKMDLIMVAKVRPTKVPNPSTKKDGRKEVCNIVINVIVFFYQTLLKYGFYSDVPIH